MSSTVLIDNEMYNVLRNAFIKKYKMHPSALLSYIREGRGGGGGGGGGRSGKSVKR